MTELKLSVPDISCDHCKRSIEGALKDQPGVKAVSVDIPGKTVALSIEAEQISIERIKELIADEGYEDASVI